MITINVVDSVNNYIIAQDPDFKIQVDVLNKFFATLVDKIGDSEAKDGSSRTKAKRVNEYVCIAGHGNVKYELLTDAFKNFLRKFDLDFDWKEVLSAEDKKLFEELGLVETSDPSIGARGGGVSEGGKYMEIEKGIKPLCDALNLFDGISTFGSCEGHSSEDPTRAYVAWKACNIDGLNYSTFSLKNAINKVWEQERLDIFGKSCKLINDENFNPKQHINKITLSFNTGYWKPARMRTAAIPGENYYEFAFRYQFKHQILVFKIIEDIREVMVSEKFERDNQKTEYFSTSNSSTFSNSSAYWKEQSKQ